MNSEEENLILIEAWRKKQNKKALDLLLEKHYNLIKKIVQIENNNKEDESMLIAEGITGLIPAIENYDPEKGAKFSTYLTFWVRAKVKKHIWTLRNFLNINYSPLVGLVQKFIYSKEKEPNQTLSELALKKNIKTNTVFDIYTALKEPYRKLRAPFDDKTRLEEITDINNHSEYFDSLHAILKKSIEILDKKHREVIEKRWLGKKKLTLDEVAILLNKSKEYVRLTEAEAFNQIKDNAKIYINNYIPGYISILNFLFFILLNLYNIYYVM